MSRIKKFAIIFGCLSACAVIGIIVGIQFATQQVEVRVHSQINQSRLAKVRAVHFSLVRRRLQLESLRVEHDRVTLNAPEVNVYFPYGIGEMIDIVKGRVLRQIHVELKVEEIQFERLQITKKALEHRTGKFFGEFHVSGADYRMNIQQFQLDEMFQFDFKSSVKAEPFSIQLTRAPADLRALTQKMKASWQGYTLESASGKFQNNGVSDMVMELLEIPREQVNGLINEALKLMSGQLSSGEELSKQALTAASSFMNTQSSIGFSLVPPQPLKFELLMRNLQTQLDLGAGDLGLKLWVEEPK